MTYTEQILALHPAPNELPLVRAGYLVAKTAAAEIAAQADARIAEIAGVAQKFLDEMENGEGCTCAKTAHDVIPHCAYCDASMALMNALPEFDPLDF